MIVGDAAEAVGQPERARPQPDAERIRKPFRQKEDAGLAIVPDVSAHIKKLVRSNRLEEPFAKAAAETRSHPPQVERDNADKGAPFPQIERERDLPF